MKNNAIQIALKTAVAALVLATGSVNLNAAPLTFTQVTQTYNAIAFDEMYLHSEIEGYHWSGSLASNTTTVGFNVSIPKANYSLVVRDGITGGPLNVNQGSVLSKTATSAMFNMNSGGTVTTGASAYANYETTVGWTLESLQAAYQSVSLTLDAQPNTGTVNSSDFNNVKITGSGAPVSYVDINAADLNLWNGITIDPNGGNLVINVHGNVNAHANALGGTSAQAGSVIWNYGNATSVSWSTRAEGSQWGWNATMFYANGAQGQVVGNVITTNGEFHNFLPDFGVIPEPSTATLLGLGLAAALFRRNRGGQ